MTTAETIKDLLSRKDALKRYLDIDNLSADIAQEEKKTDFISVAVFGNTADFVGKYFTKGSMAIVSGRLQIREWTDRNGNKKSEPEVIADRVYFGEKKAKEQATHFEEEASNGDLPF